MADPPSTGSSSTADLPPLPTSSNTPQTHTLLSLSDELLLMIVQKLDRHTEIPSTRLTCRKLNALAETYFFRNIMVSLPEEVIEDAWKHKLRLMPPQVVKAKQFTVLNKRSPSSGHLYQETICRPNSYRIWRWQLLHNLGTRASDHFSQAACLVGVQFYPNLAKFEPHQLTVFRWRHALPLSLRSLTSVLLTQFRSLEELEITMIRPPSAEDLRNFQNALRSKTFPKMTSFKYHGLSHTEPLAMNNPEVGGRFRMLRPLFNNFRQTIQELMLSQDHCISQVGKTPMTLGRTYLHTLCRLDDLYVDTTESIPSDLPSISLKLAKIELRGFYVDNLFDLPAAEIVTPRVRIDLSSLRRLVLNNSRGLGDLLPKLVARKDEIRLTELGLRLGDYGQMHPVSAAGVDALGAIYPVLRDFLLSFKGLEVLSILVDGNAKGLRVGKDVISQHADSLQAYSVAARGRDLPPVDDIGGNFAAASRYGIDHEDEINPGYLNPAPALREYGTFLAKAIGPEYPRLRYLSQFPDLRTVTIRNFPVLYPEESRILHWREGNFLVTPQALRVVEHYAQRIALPFYGLPEGYTSKEEPGPPGDFDIVRENERIRSELVQIMTGHEAKRHKLLGIPFESPLDFKDGSEMTQDVLRRRARTDKEFHNVRSKVINKTASVSEKEIFDDYKAFVQSTLGLKTPLDDTKPKLRLLIVGDWTYRDQMNLTGPRNYDPRAWRYDPDDEESYDETDEVDEAIFGYLPHSGPLGRRESERIFSSSLLPIFFSIDWIKKRDKKTKKHGWSAVATVLDCSSTLEGQGTLPDTRLLDFAWNI